MDTTVTMNTVVHVVSVVSAANDMRWREGISRVKGLGLDTDDHNYLWIFTRYH